MEMNNSSEKTLDFYEATREYIAEDKLDEWQTFIRNNRKLMLPENARFGKTERYIKILGQNGTKSYGYLCRVIAPNPEEVRFYSNVFATYLKEDVGLGFARYLLEKGNMAADVKAELAGQIDRLVAEDEDFKAAREERVLD